MIGDLFLICENILTLSAADKDGKDALQKLTEEVKKVEETNK
ncbi:MAG TPA: hypothetical protein PK624_14380 [Spirochaetota bacterium]|nr:hypothetical protein [Spirochaetota bacterium]HPK57695.1 hypothetical protein [Spirochaetota bacterium]